MPYCALVSTVEHLCKEDPDDDVKSGTKTISLVCIVRITLTRNNLRLRLEVSIVRDLPVSM